MEKGKILYQIKSLEILIFRNFIKEKEKSELAHLSPSQMQIIKFIMKNNDKNIYQRDLEKELNLRRATVSGILQTMEKNNLLKREIDEFDARSKKIILSKNIKEKFLDIEKEIQKFEKILIKNISKEELKVFNNKIKKMKNNLYENIGKDV